MILIKGAKIVDGLGQTIPFLADLLIKNDRISAIGKFPNKKADLVVDGLGLYLTPGFIDVNTHSDHHLSLFTHPAQSDFLLQGVTTTFGGVCGASLAPLIAGNLEAIRKWTDTAQVNINWHSVGELLKILESQKLGVNFGTLVGHSTIRRAMIGEDSRDLHASEMDQFKKLIEDSMKEGAFGFSTGLGYSHTHNTPFAEIRELVKVIAKYKGVYATHLRNDREGLLASIEETVKVAEETGAKVLISHFKPLIGFEKDYKKAVELIHQAAYSADIHFDLFPTGESVVPIYTLLPAWAKVGNLEIMLSYMRNPDTRNRLIAEFSSIQGNEIKISQAIGRDYLVGKTLEEFASNQDLPLPEALVKLMELTGLRSLIIYKNINLDLATHTLGREQALIGSGSASLPNSVGFRYKTFKPRRFYDTFPTFIQTVIQRKLLSLTQAIQKITSAPAKKYDLKDRGLVMENKIADLNLISLKSGAVKIEHVFVNGKLAVKDGQPQPVLAGRVLRHASS